MSAEQDFAPRRSDDSTDEAQSSSAAEPQSDASTQPKSPRPKRPPPLSQGGEPFPKASVNFSGVPESPRARQPDEVLSPAAADRVFPVRSVVSVDPTPTPSSQTRRDGYFPSASHNRRFSMQSGSDTSRSTRNKAPSVGSKKSTARAPMESTSEEDLETTSKRAASQPTSLRVRQPPDVLAGMLTGKNADAKSTAGGSTGPSSEYQQSIKSTSASGRSGLDENGPLVTARFKHIVTEGGHAVITGRGGETLQRCEDEPIHIPGAVQGFGLLIAFEEQEEGKLVVRVVSENSKRIIGYTPKQLFALDSFTDILSEDQADNLLDHVDFIRDEEADVMINGPEVFTMSVRSPSRRSQKLWCAMHINDRQPNLVICEFELEDDPLHPLVPPHEETPEPPEDTLDSRPTEEEYNESTQNASKPLRVLRSARKRKGEAAAMEVFNIMSQVQEQLAAAPNLEKFLKTLVGVVKELTGFHRVMIYQFDQAWNGRVVTELVDPRATKDLYKGLNFPASDIPKQARDLYKINKVRMLYDRDQETARLVCRTVEDLENPLDLTHAYLRAMSPIHLKYLANMAVRSSMSISINAFDELWGLIACHSYGSKGMRVSFPIRKMCRLVGDSASRNIERLSYASRLQARKLINTVPTKSNPSGYIIASSEDLLKLFDADFGLLSIRDETKILGHIEQSQEALAMLEYLRMRSVTSVMTSMDIKEDFPDLRYAPGFQVIAGLLIVPLSSKGEDFIVFFRKGQLKEVKWAGNPYEKFIKEGTEGYLEPRKSFRTWSETVVGKCREWTEEEIETAAVLCLVYGKFIEVWRQKEAALQNSQLTRLLLANSAHEVRTPLNAIINYLEIALEGSLDNETRENLAKSHSASKSLIYVINDLLDLTKTEEGGELTKDEVFDPKDVLKEATDMFARDASRKNISYEVIEHPGVPSQVIGDARRVRQAISNITANAIQNTTEGGIKIEMYPISRADKMVEVEFSISDTGVGMSSKKLDALFRELEQVEAEGENPLEGMSANPKSISDGRSDEGRTLGLGLAVVARIVRNMNGQLRLKSEEGKGSRFVVQFPFDLLDEEEQPAIESKPDTSEAGSATPLGEPPDPLPSTPPTAAEGDGEVTLIERGSANRRISVHSSRIVSRQNSTESLGSRKSSRRSIRSSRSVASASSQVSAADQLIEAIQKPVSVEGWSGSGDSHRRNSANQRPRLEQRHTTAVPGQLGSTGSPMKPQPRPRSLEAPVPQHLREAKTSVPGTVDVSGAPPMKSVRMPNDLNSPGPYDHPSMAPRVMGDVKDVPDQAEEPPTADHMRVLVAEDDPVNSRIIKKRLEKLGHEVYLTVNGEECSSAYGEKTGFFDIVLMDMQMPIVDGLTSAKLIRSFEKSHPTHILSTRASLNGRVPIIAVSASLLERDRQTYIDSGFDGWTLKPIPFDRLSDIMKGIVDREARERNLYASGMWEKGGWFETGEHDVWDADTKPSGEVPFSEPSEGVEKAVKSDDPQVKEDDGSRQTEEQERLAGKQEEEREDGEATEGPRSQSLPIRLGKRAEGIAGMEEARRQGVTEAERVGSPEPMDEADKAPEDRGEEKKVTAVADDTPAAGVEGEVVTEGVEKDQAEQG